MLSDQSKGSIGPSGTIWERSINREITEFGGRHLKGPVESRVSTDTGDDIRIAALNRPTRPAQGYYAGGASKG
jgi:hypothetical protein